MSRAPRRPKTPSLTKLVDQYLLRCRAEGKSEQTVMAYAESLRRFLRALDEDGVLSTAEAVQEEHVYAFLARSARLSASSRNRYFRETRTFFNWLVSTGRLGESPFRHMKNVRLPEKVVQPYATNDVLRLVAECPASPIGARDRAVLFLLLDTGLRVSELAQLDLDDVDVEALRVRVLHGKAGKQRVVPFSEACRKELLAYLSVRGRTPGPLFCASTGRARLLPATRLQANGVKQLLRRLGRRTGLTKVHAHRFRHTFATWAIQQGARELDVQLLLGHSSPQMVRRYSASYNAEQAARRHAAFSPTRLIRTAGPPVFPEVSLK